MTSYLITRSHSWSGITRGLIIQFHLRKRELLVADRKCATSNFLSTRLEKGGGVVFDRSLEGMVRLSILDSSRVEYA